MTTATTGQARIEIDASPQRVYELVSDITRMGEWSPECYRCEWLDGATTATVGARFRGHNRLGPRSLEHRRSRHGCPPRTRIRVHHPAQERARRNTMDLPIRPNRHRHTGNRVLRIHVVPHHQPDSRTTHSTRQTTSSRHHRDPDAKRQQQNTTSLATVFPNKVDRRAVGGVGLKGCSRTAPDA